MTTTATASTTLRASGDELFYRSWRPAGTPRAIVAIVPGFNSHSGYYDQVGEELGRRQLAVCAVDLRGRGQSPGERFYVERFSDYVNDVHAFVTSARERDPGLPVFLLGHSAGGVVACLYALEHQQELAGLICESFAFKVPAPDIALAVLKGVAHIAQHVHVLKLKNEDFSRDPAVVARMNADPLIANESQPSQTVAEMIRADAHLEESFGQITLPVLILHGTHDHATRYQGSQQFHQSAGSADKTLKLYEGAYHDLLNDTDRDLVMRDIMSWIDERLPR